MSNEWQKWYDPNGKLVPWLRQALTYLGVAEIPGKENSPVITRWLHVLRAWWSDDETPWCGVAVAYWMYEVGIPAPKHWYRAKSWLEWGVPLGQPAEGAVVVFERKGGGHVGLVVGLDQFSRLMVIGGNQGNRVSIAPFDRLRVLGYRWPLGQPPPAVAPLPVFSHAGSASKDEA